MKTTVSLNEFRDNSILKEAFSYYARVALFDYFEELERDCGIEIDFDPVAIRCEYTEHLSIENAYANYQDDEELTEAEMYEYLLDRTRVIEFETGVILQDF